MGSAYYLFVDGGATQSSATLYHPTSGILETVHGGALTFNYSVDVGDSLSKLLEPIPATTLEQVQAAVVSLAGTELWPRLTELQACGLTFTVKSDVFPVVQAAKVRGLAGGLSLGTGVVAASTGASSRQAGGWGFPFADQGGGAWLGREVVREALWLPADQFETLMSEARERSLIDGAADLSHNGVIAWAQTATAQQFGKFTHALALLNAIDGPAYRRVIDAGWRHVQALLERSGIGDNFGAWGGVAKLYAKAGKFADDQVLSREELIAAVFRDTQ